MKERLLRIRIDNELYLKFKHLCVDLELSIPKQTQKLIEHFVSVQYENNKRM